MDNYLAPIVKEFIPNIITKGKGSFVWDKEGKKILDLNSGQFCTILGHSNEELSKIVCEQSKVLQDTSTATISEDVIVAAEKFHEICSDMDGRVLFLSTGSEANECAMRYAKHLTGKPGVIGFDIAYHGLSYGSESVSMSRLSVKPQNQYAYNVPVPQVFYDDDEIKNREISRCVREFNKVVIKYKDVIAAAIFEPIIGPGGITIIPKEYFENIRKICDENDIFLIFDECQTGYGRTGSWFHYQNLGVIPDFLVCAKGVGLGYPVSAVVFNGKIIPKTGFLMQHYSSHQNEPFASKIVSFGIDYIQKNDILNKNKLKGDYFLKKLRDVSKRFSIISNPRGVGLMIGFDLYVKGVFDYMETYQKLHRLMLDSGVMIQQSNYYKTVRILPNYLVSIEEINMFVDTLESVIKNNFVDRDDSID